MNKGKITISILFITGLLASGLFFYFHYVYAAEVLVDATVTTNDNFPTNSNPTLVWTSDTDGYAFYVDSNGTAVLSTTTDSGATWSVARTVDSQTDVQKVNVWYDKWTKGDAGGLIHVMTHDNGADDLYYTEVNTSTGAISATVATVSVGGTMDATNYGAIIKTEDGNLYMAVSNNASEAFEICTGTCTTGGNWTALGAGNPGDGDEDFTILLPIPSTNNLMDIRWDISADDIESNVYSATSSSWWGWDTTICQTCEDNSAEFDGDLFGATVDNTNNLIYLVYTDDVNDYTTEDHDLLVSVYDVSTGVWTNKTVEANVSGGLTSAKIALDENTGDIYVIYTRRTTIGTATTGNIYWRKSTDGGDTWTAESSALNSTADNIRGATINIMSDERIGVMWKYITTPNADDIYYETVVDLVPSAGGGGAGLSGLSLGKIGQALSFDGIDDYIDIGNLGSGVKTVSFWMNAISTNTKIIDLNSGNTWYNSNYTYCQPITIQNAKVATTTTNGYVVLATTTQATLAATSSAGKIQKLDSNNNLPLDVIYTEGSDCNSAGALLDFHHESYASTTGTVVSWIEVTDISSTTDKSFLMYYGNSSATDVSNEAGTWGAGVDAVWHLGHDGVATTTSPDFLDSTSNNNDGSSVNMNSADLVTGQIDGALDFDEVDDYIDTNYAPTFSVTDDFSISLWYKADDVSRATDQSLIGSLSVGKNARLNIEIEGNGSFCTDEKIAFAVGDSTGGSPDGACSTTSADDTDWHHIVATYDVDGNMIIYFDSDLEDTSAVTGASNGIKDLSSTNLYIGAFNDVDAGTTVEYFDGLMDEIRIYRYVLHPMDILTDYNNQLDVASFLSYGSEATESVSPANIELVSGYISANGFTSPTIYVDGTASTTLSAGKWHHITITTDTGVSASAMEIGRIATTYFGGKLDDVRIYDRVLSEREANRLYHLGATTKIGVTLESPATQDGLVAHWSFDGKYVDISSASAEILDSSGQGNHGDSIRVVVFNGEVLVDSTANTADSHPLNSSPTIVWTSDTDGYLFYIDSNGTAVLSTSTDSGATWSSARTVDSQTDAKRIEVWYDRWTKGDTGNLIHVMTHDNGADDIWYIEVNTLTGTISIPVATDTSVGTIGTNHYPSITKTEDGALYMVILDNDGQGFEVCTSTCTTGSNWIALGAGNPKTGSDTDYSILLPVPSTNNLMFIQWDESADDIESNIYSATSTSWWGWDLTICQSCEDNSPNGSAFGATVDNTNNLIYLVYTDDVNNYTAGQEDHDLLVSVYDVSTGVWTNKTVEANVSGGLTSTKIALDENTGDIYVIYTRRTTIGTATTGNIYWRKSTDGGDTWGGEQGPLNTTADDIKGATINIMSDERIGVMWKYITTPNADDIYYETVVDLSTGIVGPTIGRIGQAWDFNGENDYIDIGNAGSGVKTVSFWMNATSTNTKIIDLNGTESIELINGYISANGFTSPTIYVDGTASTTLSAGKWYHITITTDTGINASNMDLGRISATYFGGQLDDVRMYSKALSQEEASRLYHLGATTKINTTIKSVGSSLESGLVGHWTFDGPKLIFNATDSSGQGNDGYLTGFSSTTTAPGKIGQALDFDGTDDYIDLGDDDAFTLGSQATFSVWTKIGALDGNWRNIFAKRDAGNVATEYQLLGINNSNKLKVSFPTSGTSCCTDYTEDTITLVTDVWYHFVVTFDDNTNELKWYIDGKLTETDTVTQSFGTNTATKVVIGATKEGGNEFFMGSLDDIRLYNRALSPEEISRLYQLGR